MGIEKLALDIYLAGLHIRAIWIEVEGFGPFKHIAIYEVTTA